MKLTEEEKKEKKRILKQAKNVMVISFLFIVSLIAFFLCRALIQ